MSSDDDILFNGESFSGQARLFPLPNLVMFPHVIQPLHVFEPRYRELMQDALAGDKLIAMAVLAPGWENDYEGRPALRPVACLGRIATHERLPDGRFNMLLLGLRRVLLVEELPAEHLYRMAQVELLADTYPAAGDAGRKQLHQRLMAAFRQKLQPVAHGKEQLQKLLAAEMTLGTLTDLMAYTLNFDDAFKAQLLDEINVDRRAEALLARLQEGEAGTSVSPGAKFPPDFSNN
jgi:Lon protease-like protein